LGTFVIEKKKTSFGFLKATNQCKSIRTETRRKGGLGTQYAEPGDGSNQLSGEVTKKRYRKSAEKRRPVLLLCTIRGGSENREKGGEKE